MIAKLFNQITYYIENTETISEKNVAEEEQKCSFERSYLLNRMCKQYKVKLNIIYQNLFADLKYPKITFTKFSLLCAWNLINFLKEKQNTTTEFIMRSDLATKLVWK